MWALQNHTPFTAQSGFLRDHAARSFWCVWIGASFDVRPGRLPLFRTSQPPLVQAPRFVADDPERDCLADTDFCLPKPRADVLIDAVAYPPQPGDTAPFDVTASLGDWHKTITVQPETVFDRRGNRQLPTDADRQAGQTPVALRYGQAWGGATNPVGPAGSRFLPTPRDNPRRGSIHRAA